MSDTAPLNIVWLLEELQQVTDWYMLGVYLEIPSPELDKIRQQFLSEGVERCKAALLDLWLKRNPKASWKMVAVALEKSGEKVLAEKVGTRHSLASSLLTVPSGAKPTGRDRSAVTVELEKPVVKQFTKLERTFAVIVKDLENTLEDKQTPLKDLQRFLLARLGQGGEYKRATSIDELFQQISSHYCFLNTTLLEDIIDEFIGEPLKHQLEKYEEQLEDFTSSTKITLLKEIQSQRPPNTDGMSRVVLKLRGCWLDVTIQRFQKLVSHIFRAAASALTHIHVEDGCICISWLTRDSAIPSLVALAQQKVEFMIRVNVLKLTVGDIAILEKEEEEAEREKENEEDADFSLDFLRATTAGCMEAVEFLLILGTDPNCASEDGVTPLMIACEKRSVNITKVLLKEQTNVNTQDRMGNTTLMKVSGSPVASEDLVKLLIQSGADVHTQTSTGWTALMYATCSGHSSIVHLLLSEGAEVNTQNSGGVTALMLACHYSHPDIVQLLLNKGADVNNQNSRGVTSLIVTCYLGHPDIIQLLLSFGADPNIQDHSGSTALMIACTKQMISLVKLLIAHGADPNLQNRTGWTALMHSACQNLTSKMDPAIMVLLLSAGANPNAIAFTGRTALMVAVNSGYQAGVEVLLNAKADTNIQDVDGATVLHLAGLEGHLSITKLLLAAGANASLVDIDGETALEHALDNNHRDVCQLLLMHMDSQAGPFKHWEEDEEEEKMDKMKQYEVTD